MAGLRNRTLVRRCGDGSFPDYLGNSTGWFGRMRQEKKDNTLPVGRVNFASFHFQKLATFLPSIVSSIATTDELKCFSVLFARPFGVDMCTNPTVMDADTETQ